MNQVVVTRHPALVEYLHEVADLDRNVEVITHVTSESQIAGKHVYGIIPLHLAAAASQITIVPMDIPKELRGVELSIDRSSS